jgi:cation transport ATPase
VLAENRLDRLAYLLDLSCALRARLREGAAVATLYNAIVLPLAALGWCPPAAALALSLIESLAVLANALRLPPPPAAYR